MDYINEKIKIFFMNYSEPIMNNFEKKLQDTKLFKVIRLLSKQKSKRIKH